MELIISGAMGHMGRAVAEQARAQGISICFGVDAAPGAADFPVYPSFQAAPKVSDAVVIDFSRPAALEGLLDYALTQGLPAVLATTGYTTEQETLIQQAAERIPLFRSANMSVGVALLRHLCREASRVLGASYDVEIVEAHHNRKVDAPSGTALMLVDAVKEGRDTPMTTVCGRSGRDCKRQPGEIGVHALRGGTVTGEHEVCFFGPSERIRLGHSAEDRSVFAAGALKAACYLSGKAPGLYDMEALVGGK